VQEGETLWSVANRFDVDMYLLAEANNIVDISQLVTGQVLLIPSSGATIESAEPLAYVVQPGDSFAAIADQFSSYGITFDMILRANYDILDQNLYPGDSVIVPFDQCRGHYFILEGDTLEGIAYQCQVSLDDLVNQNPDTIDPDDLNIIQPKVVLNIPQEGSAVVDCSPLPPRTQVIEHTLVEGEGLYCLSQKFGLSPYSILFSNRNQLSSDEEDRAGTVVYIPPDDGILHTVEEGDIPADTTVEELASWYQVQPENITDWNGNAITDQPQEGQQIFVAGAQLLDGLYEQVITFAPEMDDVGDQFSADGPLPGAEPPDPYFYYGIPKWDADAGATYPKVLPWVAATKWDTGYCNPAIGSGWTGSVIWPVSGRTVKPTREFMADKNHRGIDIDANIGSPVYAAAPGVIVWAGRNMFGYGNLIAIDHGGGWQTFYAHLSEVYVSCGQTVGQGDVIGATGQEGLATWPHLHFEVRYQGYNFNPRRWLP
jgi:murein DD-endopeptidase MepM/ murein hydrolase activator NlpD